MPAHIDWHAVVLLVCLPVLGFCAGSLTQLYYWRRRFNMLKLQLDAISAVYEEHVAAGMFGKPAP